MIEALVVYIQSIISAYGAWGVLVATFIEEVVAPVPSPIVPLAAGFFLLPASVAWAEILVRAALVIALPVAVGISIGSAAVYALGFFGGKQVIEKTKRWTGIKWEDIEKLEAKLTRGRSDEITLFVLRILPIIPGVAISGFCGVVRYPFKKFIVVTSIGSFIRAFVLGLVGWQVGELYFTYSEMVSKFEKYILIGVVLLVILGVGGYFLTKKSNKQNDATK